MGKLLIVVLLLTSCDRLPDFIHIGGVKKDYFKLDGLAYLEDSGNIRDYNITEYYKFIGSINDYNSYLNNNEVRIDLLRDIDLCDAHK
jgi:hypothetical protein